MDDNGKLTTMSKSLLDVPPYVDNILHFDGSSQQSRHAYEVCLKGTSKLEDRKRVFLFTDWDKITAAFDESFNEISELKGQSTIISIFSLIKSSSENTTYDNFKF